MAVRAVGGPEALRGLRSFRYAATGNRWIYDEGIRPGDRSKPSATFDERVRYVVGNRRTPNRVRVDVVRTSDGADRPVHEVISGRRGFIRGVDANGSTRRTKPMTGGPRGRDPRGAGPAQPPRAAAAGSSQPADGA